MAKQRQPVDVDYAIEQILRGGSNGNAEGQLPRHTEGRRYG
jgi:hypothetical protein